MTTRYRKIDRVNEPFDNGHDENGLLMWSFNIDVVKEPSPTFSEEIAGLLVLAGVGVFGTNIFNSSNAEIPDGDGPYLSMIETGGTSPEHTHNEIQPAAWVRPSMQITARAKKFVSARTMAYAAHDALVGIRNADVP